MNTHRVQLLEVCFVVGFFFNNGFNLRLSIEAVPYAETFYSWAVF